MWKRAGLASVAVAALLLSACTTSDPVDTTSTLEGGLVGGGTTTQELAHKAWIPAFEAANPNTAISYSAADPATSLEAFVAGESQFAGVDVGLSPEQLSGTFGACAPESGAIQVPVLASPIAVVFNVQDLDSLRLDALTLAGILRGVITMWDDPAIQVLNESAEMPSERINVVHRSDGSVSTSSLSEFLRSNAGPVWDAQPGPVFPYAIGTAVEGNAALVSEVQAEENSIGYADSPPAGLGSAAVGSGEIFVEPSQELAAAAIASSRVTSTNNKVLELEPERGISSDLYPIMAVSYVVACEDYPDQALGSLVKAYLSFVVGNPGQSLIEALGATPLPDQISARPLALIATIR